MNPNIQDVVEFFQSERFNTVDSGDGETHEHECDRDEPYVVISVKHPSLLDYHANRVKYALQRNGIEPTPVGEDGVSIQATLDPVDDSALIEVIGLTDDMLT